MMEPRDQLVHLREWLKMHREVHTRHFGESDKSGHPHGYDAVVIPSWDVLQRLDDIQASLNISHEAQESEAEEVIRGFGSSEVRP